MRRSPLSSPWLPAAIVGLATLALLVVWIPQGDHRQASIQWTYGIVAIALLLCLSWTVLLSGFRLRTRLCILGAVLATGGLLAALFRLRGVSGDVVPIFEWRFARRAEAPPLPRRAPVDAAAPPGETGLPDSRPDAPSDGFSYPQFLGPNRDGVVRGGPPLARDWASRPPRALWRRPVGEGWSGFAAAGDLAYTQEQDGERETVTCYGLRDGEPRWTHSDNARYETVLGGIGPRATPTLDGPRVYALGATGILNCLDRLTGRRIWTHDIVAENGAKLKDWGMSGSPLVVGDLVVVSAGGPNGRSLVAYARATGALIWGGGNDGASYSSPRLASLAGTPQILILNAGSVAAHDPGTGAMLWQAPWQSQHPNVAQPRPLPGDRVLVSTGYGVGAALFRVVRAPSGSLSAEEVWRNASLKAKFANFVDRDGFVYGLDDGILVCLDIETGERRWKAGRYGHGQVMLVGNLLIVTAESGDVVLVEAVPSQHRELGRSPAIAGKTWNPPALAGPYLLARNDREAVCLELPLER